MIINKTEQEKREDIVKNVKKSMSVEAGAGAGKTTIIIDRIMEQLKQGAIKADDLVVITFTNAAAEELRERLLEKIRQEAKREDYSDEERANFKRALDDQSKIVMSTIHSFCFKLLKEQSFAAKIPLDVQLLEGTDDTARKKSFFKNFYKKQKNNLLAIENEFYVGDLGNYIYDAFITICELPDDMDIKYDKRLLDSSSPKLADYIIEMEKQLDELKNNTVLQAKTIINNAAQSGLIKNGAPFTDFESMIDYIEVNEYSRMLGSFCKKINEMNSPVSVLKNGLLNELDINNLVDSYNLIWNTDKDTKRKTLKNVFQACSKVGLTGSDAQIYTNNVHIKLSNQKCVSDELTTYQHALVMDIAIKARNEYRQFCKNAENRCGITNDMLLQEALQLVKNNKMAADYFRSKFTCIYVDEFQDTDIVQRDLVLELCKDETEDSGLRAGSLFFVGDPKQSIYAFRGADIDVYESTRGKYVEDEVEDVEVYSLNNNYRSEKKIIDGFVNPNFNNNESGTGRFQKMLPEGYIEMNAVNDNPEKDDILMGVYTLDLPIWGKEKDFRNEITKQLTEAKTAEKKELKDNLKEEERILKEQKKELKKEITADKNKAKKEKIEPNQALQDKLSELEMKIEEIGQRIKSTDTKPTDDEKSDIEKIVNNKIDDMKISDVIYKNVGIARDKDADILVEIIEQLSKSDMKIYTKNENKETVTKPIEYRDFLVLCRTKKDINRYADRLKRSGIPINLYGALDIKDEDIIIRFKQLYHFLAWPYDQKAKHGAYEVLMSGRITSDNIDEAKRRASELSVRTMSMKPLELLQYLSHHLEYILEKEVSGAVMVRAQSRLQQIYEYVMNLPFGDRKTVDRYIDQYMESEIDKELSMVREQNAVRLMNLHKAKGLEGGIVIIASRTERKTRSTNETYRKDNDIYPSPENNYKKIPGYLLEKNDKGTLIAQLVNEQEKLEWIRQDYVEVTRAKEAMIFMDALTSGDSFSDYDFSNAVNLLDIKVLPDMRKEVEKIYKRVDSDNVDNSIEDDNTDKNDAGSTTIAGSNNTEKYDADEWNVELSKEQEYHQYRHMSPSGLEHSDSTNWSPGDELVDRPIGNTFGTVMHRAFELLVNMIRECDVKDIDINQPINRAIMENYMEIIYEIEDKEWSARTNQIDRYKKYLLKQLEIFINNTELVGRIKNAKTVYTEMAFAEYADKKDLTDALSVINDNGETIKNEKFEKTLECKRFALDNDEKYWINGQADLVICNPDDTVDIIDYKSDKRGEQSVEKLIEHLERAYDDQQNLYRYVVSKALGINISNVTRSYYHMYN